MMLSNADFEEIFPDLFRPERRALVSQSVRAASPACIARWEDDGGRLCDRTQSHDVSDRRREVGYAVHDPVETRHALETLPVAAALGAAWMMLASFGRVVDGR
ncbi:hypothetical protein STA1M1_37410 [Sinisalibacter aestuarii]|uniref:Uncharacterized protein n=2 Tax=Sinisalibacter aestuarii TaxID=2949426 RepID=A0ABQ5M051_9RHOB|nr:hypothetical protein STA1M1_37410 [Sinisalibacter aestuarii]